MYENWTSSVKCPLPINVHILQPRVIGEIPAAKKRIFTFQATNSLAHTPVSDVTKPVINAD